MLLLAADTSGKLGSIALARGNADGTCEVIEVVPLAGGTFSAELVPQIARLLAKHAFSKHNIGAFVVASGPGSFTGLRVGLAAIKGLAEVLGKPIAAVSLLEAVAVTSGLSGRIVASLDAGRGEVYVGEYEVSDRSVRLVREQLLSKEGAAAAARGAHLLTPDKALAEATRALGVSVSAGESLDAGSIAPVGWRKILAGNAVSPEQLEANYIRRTDAEILKNGS
jgi:tRNA threonylcarbamoyladenosine biosynthesis protein TsaB